MQEWNEGKYSILEPVTVTLSNFKTLQIGERDTSPENFEIFLEEHGWIKTRYGAFKKGDKSLLFRKFIFGADIVLGNSGERYKLEDIPEDVVDWIKD